MVLPPPEPTLAPLVWVTTGAVWPLPPEPVCEPLVWVTTGVEGEPEVGTEVEAPLAAVVTGDGEDEEE